MSKYVLPMFSSKSFIVSGFIYYRSWKLRSSIQSAKIRLGADCGSDNEQLIVKFRLKLKKVGKTTTQFSYNLNQIPYNYTLEVANRFKGIDLIDRVSEKLWMKFIWRSSDQTHPQEKEMKEAKRLSKKALK